MTSGRLLLLFATLLVLLAHARASPLDADSCAKLRAEHSQLELAGVEKDMVKGPDWAKTNLAPEQIAQVRRFIELEEQLLFRCRDKSLVQLPTEVEAAPKDDKEDKKQPTQKKPAPKKPPAAAKKAKPPAAKKTKPPAAAAKQKTGTAWKAAVEPAIR